MPTPPQTPHPHFPLKHRLHSFSKSPLSLPFTSHPNSSLLSLQFASIFPPHQCRGGGEPMTCQRRNSSIYTFFIPSFSFHNSFPFRIFLPPPPPLPLFFLLLSLGMDFSRANNSSSLYEGGLLLDDEGGGAGRRGRSAERFELEDVT